MEPTQESESSTTLGGQRRRRVPVIVMVVVLVANLFLATALYAAFAHSASSSAESSDDAVYVIPPSDAGNVFLGADTTQLGIKLYNFIYSDPSGHTIEMTMRPYDTVAVTASNLPATMALGLPPGVPTLPLEVPGLTGSVMTCLGLGSLAMNPPVALPSGSVLIGEGPMFVGPPMGGVGYVGGSLVVARVASNECLLDAEHAAVIEQAMRSLRYVSASEFYAYAATKPKILSMAIEQSPPPEPVHFDGEDLALRQVAEAIAGLDTRLADGTYPNIEGGGAPNDYDAMFDGAREASGATPGATFVSTEIWFRSSNEAGVTFAITADLPTGRQTFSQTGSVVRVDGRWVVARSTATSMLGRSALSPR
ncbi:MAG: hypothetical protein F2597_04010 [Actinobacteria bacterium]|uniref:Unannotated protein n=1 Tax=freshwater metagenome TaxID=449393 RepID=A0A6J6I4C0_9ZZZZ|nr:hypothetical protein [Actinomycetota bacterium]